MLADHLWRSALVSANFAVRDYFSPVFSFLDWLRSLRSVQQMAEHKNEMLHALAEAENARRRTTEEMERALLLARQELGELKSIVAILQSHDEVAVRDQVHANWENLLAPLAVRPRSFSALHSHFFLAPDAERDNAFSLKKADESAPLDIQLPTGNQTWLEIAEHHVFSLELAKTKLFLSHENWGYTGGKASAPPSLFFHFDVRQSSLDGMYEASKTSNYGRLLPKISVAVGLAAYFLARERLGTSLSPFRRPDVTICLDDIVSCLQQSTSRR